jgi:hypothetical protein
MNNLVSCEFLTWAFGLYVGAVILFSCWAQFQFLGYAKALAKFQRREDEYSANRGSDGEGSNAYQREIFYNIFRSSYPQFENTHLESRGRLIRVCLVAQVVMILLLIIFWTRLRHLGCM